MAGRKGPGADGISTSCGKTEKGRDTIMIEKEQLHTKTDYEHYHFSALEFVKYLGQALALCIIVDYLFYKNIWVKYDVR